MKTYSDIFDHIISPENLFSAWDEFKKGKQNKSDVQQFEFNLEKNLFQLHRDLKDKTYRHGPYKGFYISDPKVRHIHKATARDRVLHHAVFKVLNPIFEPTFIPNSFSCRISKGTHKGVFILEQMLRKESRNYTRPCFVLKCDVKKFFDSIDHDILFKILLKRIRNQNALWLLTEIIESYATNRPNMFERKGLPIGNLTSQLFANVYLNELDQFVKHKLRIPFYVRYTDDFMIVADNKEHLGRLLTPIEDFLRSMLSLELHPKKVEIRKFRRGIDFLGYIVFPHYRLLRAKTKRRIFRKLQERTIQYQHGAINQSTLGQSLQSYLGVFSHANTYKLAEELKNHSGFG